MKFCDIHWTALRAEIERVGLWSLVPESGDEAGRKLLQFIDEGTTIDNFDPLMAAHNAIWSRAMDTIKDMYQQNPLMVMADSSEHPEWACPICALNWCHAEHNRLCEKPNCDYPKSLDWADEMITGSANYVLEEWKSLRV